MRESLLKFASQFETKSIIRGLELYQVNAVSEPLVRGNKYYFDVEGNSDDYEVEIFLNDSQEVEDVYCSCPHFNSGHLCKHIYASLLELSDVLDNEEEEEDETPLYTNIDKPTIIEANSTSTIKPENENNDENSTKKKKLTNSALHDLKSYFHSYDVDEDSLTNFLSKFELSSKELVSLFQMIRKQRPLEIFLSYYKDKLDKEFFENIDLFSFPNSFPLKALASFLVEHSNMLEYLSDLSLAELLSKKRTPDLDVRTTLLFLCLSLKRFNAIKCYFAEQENHLVFTQDDYLIKYMKANLTKEQCLACFAPRIETFTLTRMEAAFIYPYLSSTTKSEYKNFFSHHDCANRNYYYYNYDKGEYQYGLPLDRNFFYLLDQQPTDELKLYDLKTMYYLRELIFTDENMPIFEKRFKQLAQTLFRSKSIDFKKIYCCLNIILEYKDKSKVINDLIVKANECLNSTFESSHSHIPQLFELYYKFNSIISDYPIKKYNKEA